ncbi:MAG TPA: hypothetical protein DDW50_12745 [Firmicutes bacterium]|jgi:hypothetical protein|nr:hypothetical protein [Bacillota bacterium]
MKILISRSYWIKGILLFTTTLMLLVIAIAPAAAAPFLENGNRLTMFFSWDHVGSGNFGDNGYESFTGTACGVAFPVGFANVGFKTTFDTSEGYYEIFSDFNGNENLFMNVSLLHMKDKAGNSVAIARFGASRPLVMDLDQGGRIDCTFGPGLSVISTDNATNLSMFLQAKTKVYFMEGSFIYANGLYDFMYKAANVELGIGFSY